MIKKYQIDLEAKQINLFNERFYKILIGEEKEEFIVPSVTTYLEAYPKGYGYDKWLKEQGENADKILTEAGQLGDIVHQLIGAVLSGETVYFSDGEKEFCTVYEWERFLLWCDWFKTTKPEPILIEQIVYSIEYQFAGTMDLLCKIGDDIVLCDWKTGNYIYNPYYCQLAAYHKAVIEMGLAEKIDRCIILHLNQNLNKKGWREIKVNELEYNFEGFTHSQALWLRENKTSPKFISLPLTVSLKTLTNEN